MKSFDYRMLAARIPRVTLAVLISFFLLALATFSLRFFNTRVGVPHEIEQDGRWPGTEGVMHIPGGAELGPMHESALIILDERITGPVVPVGGFGSDAVVTIGETKFQYAVDDKWFALVSLGIVDSRARAIKFIVPTDAGSKTVTCNKLEPNLIAANAYPKIFTNYFRYQFGIASPPDYQVAANPPHSWVTIDLQSEIELPDKYFYGILRWSESKQAWWGAVAVPADEPTRNDP